MRGTAVGPDVLVSAVLIGEAAKEGLARHAARNVRRGVLTNLAIVFYNWRRWEKTKNESLER